MIRRMAQPVFKPEDIQAYRQSYQTRQQRGLAERETNRQEALQAVERVVPPIATKYPAVKAVYLFGSILRLGAFRPDSDVDLAIAGGTAEDYFALWQELQEALPYWLVDLRDLPPGAQFTERVYTTGKRLYG